jgi:hypothetical protein
LVIHAGKGDFIRPATVEAESQYPAHGHWLVSDTNDHRPFQEAAAVFGIAAPDKGQLFDINPLLP